MKPLLQVGVDSCSEQPAVARMQTTGQVHGATCRSTLLRLTHSPVARGGSQTPRRTDTQLPSAVWPVPQGSLFNVQSLLWAGAGGYDSRSSPRHLIRHCRRSVSRIARICPVSCSFVSACSVCVWRDLLVF